MESKTRSKKIGLAVLCLGLMIWGLTDVRTRAHFDPEAAAQDRAVIMKHRTDLSVFTEAGAAFFDGRDPYEVTNPRGWMYLYPPLFAIVISPLNTLEPQWQGVAWYFISLAMAWGCYRETLRLLRLSRGTDNHGGADDPKTLRWIGIGAMGAVLFPVLDCLQRGQLGVMILYLVLLGSRLVFDSESWQKAVAGGVVLALSIVFKVIPVLPVFFLLFFLGVRRLRISKNKVRPFRFWGAGTGVMAGCILFLWLVPSVFIGWQANNRHLNTWSELVGTRAVETSVEAHFSNPHSPRNQSLNNALYHFGNRVAYWLGKDNQSNPWYFHDNRNRFMSSHAATQAVLVVRILWVLLLIPLAWKLAGRSDPLDGLAAFGMSCMAMLIASPITRGHYFMLEWPAVLFVSLWLLKNIGPRPALICAGVPIFLSLIHYGLLTWSGPWGVLGIGSALWYVAMAYLLIKTPSLQAEAQI